MGACLAGLLLGALQGHQRPGRVEMAWVGEDGGVCARRRPGREAAAQLGTSVTARRRRGASGCGSRETGGREATENSLISISWCDNFLGVLVANSSEITYLFGFFWSYLS
jgi:hypothetical protein